MANPNSLDQFSYRRSMLPQRHMLSAFEHFCPELAYPSMHFPLRAVFLNKDLYAIAAILGLVLYVYFETLGFYPTHLEDLITIGQVRENPVGSLFEGWLQTNAFYRPVAMLSFSVNQHLWGINGFAYQLTTLLMFALMLVTFYSLLRRLNAGTPLALTATLLLCGAPTSVSAGAANVERSNSLVGLGLLVVLHILVSSLKQRNQFSLTNLQLGVVATGLMVAVGAKESGMVVAMSVIFGVIALPIFSPLITFSWKDSRKLLVVLVVVPAIYVTFRIALGITDMSASDSLAMAERISNIRVGMVQSLVPLFDDSGNVQYLGRSLWIQLLCSGTIVALTLWGAYYLLESQKQRSQLVDPITKFVLLVMIGTFIASGVSLAGLDYYGHRLIFLGTMSWLVISALLVQNLTAISRLLPIAYLAVALTLSILWFRDASTQISIWQSQRESRVQMTDQRIPVDLADEIRARYDIIEIR